MTRSASASLTGLNAGATLCGGSLFADTGTASDRGLQPALHASLDAAEVTHSSDHLKLLQIQPSVHARA